MAKLTKEGILALMPEINEIKDSSLRDIVCKIWCKAADACCWEKVEDAKFNSLCPGVTLIAHTRAVAQGAIALAEAASEKLEISFCRDKLLALSILHDVCKLLECDPNEECEAQKNQIGKCYQHGYLSAYYAQLEGLPVDMVGDLIAHTRHSREIPTTLEGMALFYADTAIADFSRKSANAPLHISRIKA